MSTYVSNRNNSSGKTDENGHFRFPLKLVDGFILKGFEVQAQSTPTMTLNITAGEIKIPSTQWPSNGIDYFDADYSYAAWSDSTGTVTISAADSSNPRIDRIVAYIDLSVLSTSNNNLNALKFAVIKGSASASPSAKSNTTVNSSSPLSSTNPWVELARVNVPKGATSITSANIDTSHRSMVSLSSNVGIPNITTSDGSKIQFAVINEGDPLPSATAGVITIVLVAKS